MRRLGNLAEALRQLAGFLRSIERSMIDVVLFLTFTMSVWAFLKSL